MQGTETSTTKPCKNLSQVIQLVMSAYRKLKYCLQTRIVKPPLYITLLQSSPSSNSMPQIYPLFSSTLPLLEENE